MRFAVGEPHEGLQIMIHMLDTYFQSAMYRLKGNDEGATATEYIVLLVFIALAIIVGATFLGEQINAAFNRGGEAVRDEIVTP